MPIEFVTSIPPGTLGSLPGLTGFVDGTDPLGSATCGFGAPASAFSDFTGEIVGEDGAAPSSGELSPPPHPAIPISNNASRTRIASPQARTRCPSLPTPAPAFNPRGR